jgi:hypothetical protein
MQRELRHAEAVVARHHRSQVEKRLRGLSARARKAFDAFRASAEDYFGVWHATHDGQRSVQERGVLLQVKEFAKLEYVSDELQRAKALLAEMAKDPKLQPVRSGHFYMLDEHLARLYNDLLDFVVALESDAKAKP